MSRCTREIRRTCLPSALLPVSPRTWGWRRRKCIGRSWGVWNGCRRHEISAIHHPPLQDRPPPGLDHPPEWAPVVEVNDPAHFNLSSTTARTRSMIRTATMGLVATPLRIQQRGTSNLYITTFCIHFVSFIFTRKYIAIKTLSLCQRELFGLSRWEGRD